MAWSVLSFSREGRMRLSVVLRALLIGQLAVSLCMLIFCYNVSLKVMLLLKHIHKVTVYLLYGLILLQAYSMKLHYTAGIRLVALLLHCPHWSRINVATTVWMLTGAAIPAEGILVYNAARATMKALMKELSSSIRSGISQYLTEPSWKQLMDKMQVELSCCGAERPEDWHEIPWINMDFLNEDSELVMKLAGSDGKVLPPVSPYSCCTPRVLAACYHDPLQQSDCRDIWRGASPLPSASLHARGCVEAVRAPLANALLGLQIFNMLVFILEAVILVLSQLLRSSARDAALTGAYSGVGRAVLWGYPPSHPPRPVVNLPVPQHLLLLTALSICQQYFADRHLTAGHPMFTYVLALNDRIQTLFECRREHQTRVRSVRRLVAAAAATAAGALVTHILRKSSL